MLQANTWETQPTKPSWTLRSRRAPVFCKGQQALAPHNNGHPSPPTLKSFPQGIQAPYHNSYVLDYSHPAQWLVGASRPRLQTQMGVKACDGFHMSHWSCKSAQTLMFSFHLSSLSLFWFWKWPDGRQRWGYRGSNVISINAFQHKLGIQSQYKVSTLLNNYLEVKDCRDKTRKCYKQKANIR